MNTTTIIVWHNMPTVGYKTVMTIDEVEVDCYTRQIVATVTTELPSGEHVSNLVTFPAVKRNLLNSRKLMSKHGVEI